MKIETRTIEITEGLEVRIEGESENKLVGYAAVFNTLSADLGGFRERILPGAFRQSIEGSADIRALVGHDSAKLLGRTSSGTLRLSEDQTGLRFEVDLPAATYAEDLKALVKRRDIRGMSFGFFVRNGGERFFKDGGQIVRELSALDLTEVSAVASPAYGSTSVQLRVDPAAVEAAKAAASNCPSIAARLLQWVEQLSK